ncbi:hypothetical protein Syun_011143 [Stephania yunnanensis]|uniref:Ubiquitin-like domain-containing protein n=1 Tax=Stephania yunnanensis TaxID=152371 RepID=A0AAP0PE58_9MAGN
MWNVRRDDDNNNKPRVVFVERCLNVASKFKFVTFAAYHHRSSYHKLPPPQLFKLTIHKLDRSSFDVCVARTGTVAELKKTIEDVFAELPREGEREISWSDVWGHFCLCYKGMNLVEDKAFIRSYGVKDGDQLHFVHHLSLDRSPLKKRSKGRTQTRSVTGSDIPKESNIKVGSNSNSVDDLNENYEPYHFDEAFHGEPIGQQRFKLLHLVKTVALIH